MKQTETDFDILSLEILDTADMPVTDANGKPQFTKAGLPITISYHSPGTKQYMKAKHDFDEKRSGLTVAVMQGKDLQRKDDDDAREQAEFLAAVTASLNNFSYLGKVGYEGFKALYMNPKLAHIADAGNRFVANRANFMPRVVETSESSSGTAPG